MVMMRAIRSHEFRTDLGWVPDSIGQLAFEAFQKLLPDANYMGGIKKPGEDTGSVRLLDHVLGMDVFMVRAEYRFEVSINASPVTTKALDAQRVFVFKDNWLPTSEEESSDITVGYSGEFQSWLETAIRELRVTA